MEISVIVPCRNGEAYIRQCLQALLAQSLPRHRYEVIVVDDGSTDRSSERVREHASVRLLEVPPGGSYTARNAGVRAARGRILAFTDSDCVVCPTWLAQIVEAMEGSGVQVVLGARRFAAESIGLEVLADYEMEKARYVFSRRDPRVYYGYTNNMAVRRETFERHGPFVELTRGADAVFVSRVAAAEGCDTVSFLPELLLRHLEIEVWSDWPRKMFLYGRSYRGFRHLSGTHPLGIATRVAILARTARSRPFRTSRIGALLGLAFTTAIAFELGRRFGAVERRDADAPEPVGGHEPDR